MCLLCLHELVDTSEIDDEADDAKEASKEQRSEGGPCHKYAKERASKRQSHSGSAKPCADSKHARLVHEACADSFFEFLAFEEEPQDEENVATDGQDDGGNDGHFEAQHVGHCESARCCDDECGGIGVKDELVSQRIQCFAGLGDLTSGTSDVAVQKVSQDCAGKQHCRDDVTPVSEALRNVDVRSDECDADADDGNPVGGSDVAVGASKPAVVGGIHGLENVAERLAYCDNDRNIPAVRADGSRYGHINDAEVFLCVAENTDAA